MNELVKIDSCILILDEKSFTKLLLYREGKYDSKNKQKYYIGFFQIYLF